MNGRVIQASSHVVLLVVIFLVLDGDSKRIGLDQQLRLQLVLLDLSQLAQLIHYLSVVLETAGPDDFSCFPISFRLGYLVVLFPHMHVPSGISCVFFATVVQAWELLLKLLSTPPDVLFPLVLPTGVPHLDILYEVVH